MSSFPNYKEQNIQNSALAFRLSVCGNRIHADPFSPKRPYLPPQNCFSFHKGGGKRTRLSPLSIVECDAGALYEQPPMEGQSIALDVNIPALLVANKDTIPAPISGKSQLGHRQVFDARISRQTGRGGGTCSVSIDRTSPRGGGGTFVAFGSGFCSLSTGFL
jgi:hypothetical protein